jgi:hypothetical protein
MVELDDALFDGIWPKSVPKGELRKEILLPALEAEFSSFRSQGAFAEMFQAAEADEVAAFMEGFRAQEVEKLAQQLVRGHRWSITKATGLGLIDTR